MVNSNVVEGMFLKKITGNVFRNINSKITNKKDKSAIIMDYNFELIYASAFKEDESKYFDKVDNVGDLDMDVIFDLIEEINELNKFNKNKDIKEDNDNKSNEQ